MLLDALLLLLLLLPLHAACEHLIVKLDLLSIAVVVQELAQESRAG